MLHMKGTTQFPTLASVRRIKLTCDFTVMYTYDSVYGVCFPAVKIPGQLFKTSLANYTNAVVTKDTSTSENINIRFGTKLYRQIVGIPMGTIAHLS